MDLVKDEGGKYTVAYEGKEIIKVQVVSANYHQDDNIKVNFTMHGHGGGGAPTIIAAFTLALMQIQVNPRKDLVGLAFGVGLVGSELIKWLRYKRSDLRHYSNHVERVAKRERIGEIHITGLDSLALDGAEIIWNRPKQSSGYMIIPENFVRAKAAEDTSPSSPEILQLAQDITLYVLHKAGRKFDIAKRREERERLGKRRGRGGGEEELGR